MIVADNISKYYGANAAVSDVSFSIHDHEVVGLLGLNGAGKTTALRILSGLLVPTSGNVKIKGIDMAVDPEHARAQIGFLPETPPLYPDMTVERFLRFVANINGIHDNQDQAIHDALEETDLLAVRNLRIDTLSHGFKRRVGLAHVVVHRPALILLDEPTSGLDPVQIVQMRSLIRSLKERHTIMVSSHVLPEIHQFCDRILVLHDGKIVAEGTEDELGQASGAGASIEVEVRAGAEKLAGALAAIDAVSSHEIRHERDGLTEATVKLARDVPEELAAGLIKEGIGLRRLSPTTLELESIFLQLTGDEKTTGAARA